MRPHDYFSVKWKISTLKNYKLLSLKFVSTKSCFFKYSRQSDQAEEDAVPAPIPTPAPVPVPAPAPAPAPVESRDVALQMASNSVLTPVSETPPETTTTTTTTPRSNKWARFQVYSKYRGSRTGLAQAGFGVAFGQALAANNITLIPRSLFFSNYSAHKYYSLLFSSRKQEL